MKYWMTFVFVCTAFTAGCNTQSASAQDELEVPPQSEDSIPDEKMTAASLTELIKKFDENAEAQGNAVQFTLQERDLIFVYDENADRMRVITPIANAALADAALMERMLQANYDAVLDVRYAVANNLIWAVYIHKLSTVTQDDFLSGVAQAVTAAETFGTSFTSGAMVFGGGDSSGIHSDLLEELEKAAEEESKGTGI